MSGPARPDSEQSVEPVENETRIYIFIKLDWMKKKSDWMVRRNIDQEVDSTFLKGLLVTLMPGNAK